jgi:hypothetical protein
MVRACALDALVHHRQRRIAGIVTLEQHNAVCAIVDRRPEKQ